ncbi:MAG TPA: hypothetical protein VLC28_03565 [Flavitalea sp.]|nr:hypothetical protein [Flavitalea sp.]
MKMVICRFVLLFLLSFSLVSLYGQDSLPNFTVVSKGNGRAIISWVNALPNVKQISIQRSNDSTHNFKSIMTVADPELPQNGFADTKATGVVFYRLFILRDSGVYVFSRSKRPQADNGQSTTASALSADSKQVQIAATADARVNEINAKTNAETTNPSGSPAAAKPERMVYIMRNDSLISKVGDRSLKRFRDSIVTRTKDTMVFKTADTIVIKSFVPKEVYKASKYVYTEKDGNVAVALPEVGVKEYQIKFYEDNNDPLFEIQQVKEKYLLLEKANFLHAGWFRFELFEDGKLKEKQKFYIPKDF